MLLKDILYKAGAVSVSGNTDVEIGSICFDSRQVEKGSLFIAVKGIHTDGHLFIEKAVSLGATAVVCETLPDSLHESVNYIKVAHSNQALGWIASNFYGNPSSKLKLVGVTGTNGKTTTVTLLHDLCMGMGVKAGLLSTVCNKINDAVIPSTHTTPDAIQLNKLLSEMLEDGCTHCFMEVSSHAAVQQRIAGLSFAGGVFTNISHDHLDYHNTFGEYIAAKKSFFDILPENAFALTNTDDKNGMVMLQNTKAVRRTYALKSSADYKSTLLENSFAGLHLNLNGKDVWFRLVGHFNAYNLTGIFAVASLLGFEEQSTLQVMSNLGAVEGRFETLKSQEGITAIIDYAHTPDALKNVLSTINDVREETQAVITVVGCGGDRDCAKRPVMAAIACELSTKVVITSDNPRSEDPAQIIREMMSGVDVIAKKKTITIENRKEAISAACAMAKAGDIVLIAGKGHEKYQEIKGVKHAFDDKKIVLEIFNHLK